MTTRKNNFLVSVFLNSKCVDLFYSEDLCELHVCRMLYKGCEIEVHDMRSFNIMPAVEMMRRETETMALTKGKAIPDQVVCVETKTVYPSLDVCAQRNGFSSYELMAAMVELSTIGGRHYLFSSDLFNGKDLTR